MNLTLDWMAVLIGIGIGLLSSIFGAILQYRALQHSSDIKFRVPNLFLPISGALGVLGVVVIFLSLITGWLQLALLTGVGVVSGFLLGFLIMIALSYTLHRTPQRKHGSQRTHGA